MVLQKLGNWQDRAVLHASIGTAYGAPKARSSQLAGPSQCLMVPRTQCLNWCKHANKSPILKSFPRVSSSESSSSPSQAEDKQLQVEAAPQKDVSHLL